MLKRFSTGSLSLCFTVSVLLLSGCGGGSSSGDGGGLSIGSTKAELGKKIFFDESLSNRGNQSCASCHDPDHGFADGRVSETAPVSEGSDANAFGNRNAPTAAYASFSPEFGLVPDDEQDGETDSKYRGGQFLDGRAANLVEQAKGPFPNTLEMNIPVDQVVAKVQVKYADDFIKIYGPGAFDNTETAFDNIADAIAAFEKSAELNPFTSKYDAYLRGEYSFEPDEQRGLELFIGSASDGKDAKCNNCHTLNETVGSASDKSLFTNFEYYNIGTPSNAYATTPVLSGVDNGLGGGGNEAVPLGDRPGQLGKFKVPTLRNVALTSPYMHNGVYKTLREVIEHYDIFASGGLIAGPPEVGSSDRGVDDPLIANELEDVDNEAGLGLDSVPVTLPAYNDYDALEAFMRTLTDGYIQ